MNDTLLDDIKLAYTAQNLQPIRRIFFLQEGGVDFGCPLVALAIHRGLVDRANPENVIDGGANAALEWAAAELGEDFVLGLLDGFDGHGQLRSETTYLKGQALGEKAAQELSPRDPPV